MLSVYTVPEGFSVEPENATLTEMAGAASDTVFTPGFEIFSDKEHLTRAAVHMTLFQQSKLTLKQVIQRALCQVNGTPIDVRNPMIRNRRPVADVIIATEDRNGNQDSATVTVDLLSGRAKIQ